LVIGPVKIVPDMTYNVFGGTLSLAQPILVILIDNKHVSSKSKIIINVN